MKARPIKYRKKAVWLFSLLDVTRAVVAILDPDNHFSLAFHITRRSSIWGSVFIVGEKNKCSGMRDNSCFIGRASSLS